VGKCGQPCGIRGLFAYRSGPARAAQLAALKATIDAAEIDVVVAATPVDLARLLRLDRPVVRARYEFADVAADGLAAIVDRFAASVAGGRGGR
jgi:predicted GTPase